MIRRRHHHSPLAFNIEHLFKSFVDSKTVKRDPYHPLLSDLRQELRCRISESRKWSKTSTITGQPNAISISYIEWIHGLVTYEVFQSVENLLLGYQRYHAHGERRPIGIRSKRTVSVPNERSLCMRPSNNIHLVVHSFQFDQLWETNV